MQKKAFDYRLYFVTPEIKEGWCALIEKVVKGGATLVQIRDKQASKAKILQAAKKIQPFLQENKVPLIINDHVEVAKEVGAGVHLGQSDLSVKEARMILGEKACIGISLENLHQLPCVREADYIAASPVFPSQTKKCATFWGLDGLQSLRQSTNLPLIAIGGVKMETLASLIESGVDGVAVISALAKAPCPQKAAAQFIQKWEVYKKKLG